MPAPLPAQRDQADPNDGDSDQDERSDDGRDESEQVRADRNFNELLQELRVAQTGVQILFAFLLTLPFTQKFDLISDPDRYTYLGTLLAAAAASAFLIAPVSWHRILFRQGTSDRLAMVGLFFLVVAVSGAVYLIFDFVVGGTAAAIITTLTAGLFVTLWFVLPLLRLHRREE
jgi:TRAP-type uncharacterized transport system fused permease subunit